MRKLREKREQIMNELDAMVEKVGVEQRALTVEERDAFNAKKAEIENIDETIKMIEDERALKAGKTQELAEKRSQEEIENRALDAFYRGQMSAEEERAMLTTNNGNQATLPVTIANGILKKLEEMCPVLEKARRFSSKGTLRLINETSYGDSAITGENAKFHDSDTNLSFIELKSWKITSSVKVSFELLANSEVDLNKYLTEVIVRRLAKEINKNLVSSTKSTTAPEGLICGTQICEVGTELTIQDFIMAQTTCNPEYLDNAFWIMNRKTFQSVAKLMDNMGRPYMTTHVIGEKIQYRLLGLEIKVDMHMPDVAVDAKPFILANVAEGYSVNILQNITVRHLTEVGFTEGTETFAGYVMLDGKITNQDAIVVAQCKESKGKK